jgi:hypothetical protein
MKGSSAQACIFRLNHTLSVCATRMQAYSQLAGVKYRTRGEKAAAGGRLQVGRLLSFNSTNQ